jgi:MOSC domain-containing protein YiiM
MMVFAPDSPLGRLLAAPMRAGEVVWLGERPARRAAMRIVPSSTLIAQRGIKGDRYESSRDGPRQVTLIAAEDLAAIAAFLGRDHVAPDLLRRNVVTRGINLLALKQRRFHIGTALLEMSGDCAPCSRMEEVLGPGGYNAVRGHGGITARIVAGGEVHVGDAVVRSEIALDRNG